MQRKQPATARPSRPRTIEELIPVLERVAMLTLASEGRRNA